MGITWDFLSLKWDVPEGHVPSGGGSERLLGQCGILWCLFPCGPSFKPNFWSHLCRFPVSSVNYPSPIFLTAHFCLGLTV